MNTSFNQFVKLQFDSELILLRTENQYVYHALGSARQLKASAQTVMALLSVYCHFGKG